MTARSESVGSANAPRRSANVVVESIVIGRRLSLTVCLCAVVSRRVMVSVSFMESAPTRGLVVVSPVFRAKPLTSADVRRIARLSTTPGTSLAVIAPA